MGLDHSHPNPSHHHHRCHRWFGQFHGSSSGRSSRVGVSGLDGGGHDNRAVVPAGKLHRPPKRIVVLSKVTLIDEVSRGETPRERGGTDGWTMNHFTLVPPPLPSPSELCRR